MMHLPVNVMRSIELDVCLEEVGVRTDLMWVSGIKLEDYDLEGQPSWTMAGGIERTG
jgi:hypothetical protein